MEEIKTDGFYDRENDRKHVFIPPAPTETERGGITAKNKTTESLEVTVDSETGKAYVALDSTLSKAGEAADSAEVGKKISVLNDIICGTPHTDTVEEYLNRQRTGVVYQSKEWKSDNYD